MAFIASFLDSQWWWGQNGFSSTYTINVHVNDLTRPRETLDGFNLVVGDLPKLLYFPKAFSVGGDNCF